jgi:hypothetical protein
MKQRKIVQLAYVRAERRASEASQVRRTLFRCVRNASDWHGANLSGFALVTWNRAGDMRSSLSEGHGPVSIDVIPCQVRDALNRHVAAEIVRNGEVIDPFDYEPEPEDA